LLAEMSMAVAVIERSGRSSRPAISQPNATDSTAVTAITVGPVPGLKISR
jgi:hypothetical protein